MKKNFASGVLGLALVGFILAACGVRAARQQSVEPAPPSSDYVFSSEPLAGPDFYQSASEVPLEEKAGEVVAVPEALPTAAVYSTGPEIVDTDIQQSAGHMIIKNAEVRLLVEDTDVALDRTTQVVGDLGGYIISSRIWYQDYYNQNLKYATITIGVPVDQFEQALSRLRNLAKRVLDETASGEDVTDQYVDLQSQLLNLEATRERIKTFLDQAQSIDEALRINQELSEIERQIEEIKGRINYLSDRSAYSTITVSFEPDFPLLTPTPAPTPTATPTPIPWKPGDTFYDARQTIVYAYQGIADFLIWFFVVLVPLLAPPALLVWAAWRFLRRRL
jgi:hypothetical protein